MEYHNKVRLHVAHFLNQVILAVRHLHMYTIVTFRFERIRKTSKDDSHFRFFCRFYRLCHQSFIDLVFLQSIAFRVGDIRHAFRRFQRSGYPEGINVRTSAALISRVLGKRTDKRHTASLLQRQDPFIFQQDHGLCFYFFCQRMVFFHIKHFILLMIHIIKDHIQNPFHRAVQNLLFQGSVFDSLHDLTVCLPAGCRHFQFQPCLQPGNTFIDCAPVRHYIPFITPFFSEYFIQQPRILRCEDSVDLIIRAHNRFGLCLFDRCLKSRQINLPKRSFIHFGGGGHSVVFLVVRRKMLDRRSHTFLLDTLNMSLRHLTSQIRVFRKILKVSAAQRGTFDIYCRSKQNRNIFRLAFFSKGRSHLLQQIAVKGACRRTSRGETYRLDTLIDSQMIGVFRLLSQSVRSVGNHHFRNSQTFHRFQMPEILAGTHACLFFQCHLTHDLFYISFHE